MAKYPAKAKSDGKGRALRKDGHKWLARIKDAESAEDHWIKDAEKAVTAYTGQQGDTSAAVYGFNILFANTETIVPAVINSPPAPDIRRRFADGDATAKDLAELIERAIRVQVDDSKLQVELEAQAQDAFLAGRGIMRLRFKSKTSKDAYHEEIAELADKDDKPGRDEAGKAEGESGDGEGSDDGAGDGVEGASEDYVQTLTGERICFEAVSWRDFRHGPAKRWEDVNWMAFRHAISTDDIDDFTDHGLVSGQLDSADALERGETDADVIVWEVWDKKGRDVRFIRDGDGVVLKKVDDPLGLSTFFPISTPVQPIEVTGRLMPVNPFSVYRHLAEELDLTTQRINLLTTQMKVKGWYSGDASDIDAMVRADDDEFVPISNSEIWAQHGGLQGAVLFWPIERFIQVIRELYSSRAETKQAIYEITGISDIIRGASNAQETLGAQEIKTQWGSLRIQKMQRMMERSVRDLFLMMSEIIPTKFSHQTLQDMTAIQLVPTEADQTPVPMPQPFQPAPEMPPEQAQQMQQEADAAMQQAQQQEQARLDKLGTIEALTGLMQKPLAAYYRVDVESDSTIRADLSRQKEEVAGFLQAMGNYLSAVSPMVQGGSLPAEVAVEILGSNVRLFNLGKSVEDALEQWQLAAKNPPPEEPPAPDPAQQAQAEAIQAETAAKQAEAQGKAAMDQIKLQSAGLDLQLRQALAQIELQKAGLELQIKQADLMLKQRQLAQPPPQQQQQQQMGMPMMQPQMMGGGMQQPGGPPMGPQGPMPPQQGMMNGVGG